MMNRNDVRYKDFPVDILFDILSEEYDRATVKLLRHYEQYMIKIATISVWDEETGNYSYYVDEDLLEEMRVSIFKGVRTFRKSLHQKLNAYQD